MPPRNAARQDPERRAFLITGAGGYVGREVARRLSGPGRLLLLQHRAGGLAGTDARVRAEGSRTLHLRGDLRDPRDLERMVAAVRRRAPELAALVHCAGVCPRATLDRARPAQWNDAMAVNCLAFAHLAGALRAELVAGRAAVVAVSSAAAGRGPVGRGVYAATKAALEAVVRTLAVELGPSGVRVNAVAPGFLAGGIRGRDPRLPPGVPLGRLGTATDVADLVGFLVSDRSAYISGCVIPIDGALTAALPGREAV